MWERTGFRVWGLKMHVSGVSGLCYGGVTEFGVEGCGLNEQSWVLDMGKT